MTANMPPAEIEVSSRLVSDLLEAQRPDLAELTVADNAEMEEIGRLTLENVRADREAIRAAE